MSEIERDDLEAALDAVEAVHEAEDAIAEEADEVEAAADEITIDAGDDVVVDVEEVAVDEVVAEEAAAEADAPAEAAAEEAAAPAADDEDPYAQFRAEFRALPGKWYVIHSYAGYEKRVKQNVENRRLTQAGGDDLFQMSRVRAAVVHHQHALARALITGDARGG